MQILNGLTLTPFEWTMSNEVAGGLMEFVVRLCCTGSVDVEKFNQAIISALKQQPLLQANASIGATHSTSYWRPASNLKPVIEWIDGEPTAGRGAIDGFRPIELEDEIGFRFYGWRFTLVGETETQAQTEMRFVFQHACCDGKGSFDFVEDVLLEYQFLVQGKRDDAVRIFDCERIVCRDQHERHSFNLADRIWRTFVVRPRRAANMLRTRPLSLELELKPKRESGEADLTDTARQCSVTLDAETTKKIGDYARSVGATTNLVLAHELFHVLGDCLNRRGSAHNGASVGGAGSSDLIRMLIPFSLRSETHQRMPAANCVSMAYLETKLNSLNRDDAAEGCDLLPDLVNQLAFIRRWSLQYSWIESIKSLARISPLLRLFKRNQSNRFGGQQIATTVFTNLGRVFSSGLLSAPNCEIKIGSLEIRSAHMVVPCNTRQSINFSVNFYCNRLTLEVSYLPSAVTVETAQSLLDSWQRRIRAATLQAE